MEWKEGDRVIVFGDLINSPELTWGEVVKPFYANRGMALIKEYTGKERIVFEVYMYPMDETLLGLLKETWKSIEDQEKKIKMLKASILGALQSQKRFAEEKQGVLS